MKKYHDSVTLTSSFDQPKAGQYNVSTTMDPLLQEYLSNREKALVPVGNRSLVPYGSYKPIFTLCNNGKVCISFMQGKLFYCLVKKKNL